MILEAHAARTSDTAVSSQAIERSLAFMRQRYAEPASLEQLAAVAQLSPSQFAAAFRREVGLPPYRFLSQLRIRAAKALLKEGWTAAEVALEVGFFDQSHMNRHFKRACGVTPGQFIADRAHRDRATAHASPAHGQPAHASAPHPAIAHGAAALHESH